MARWQGDGEKGKSQSRDEWAQLIFHDVEPLSPMAAAVRDSGYNKWGAMVQYQPSPGTEHNKHKHEEKYGSCGLGGLGGLGNLLLSRCGPTGRHSLHVLERAHGLWLTTITSLLRGGCEGQEPDVGGIVLFI